MHCVHSEKRNVFSSRPNTASVCNGSPRCLGSEFQSIGPATEKARRPYVVSRWDGITSWWLAAERRCCLEAVFETGAQQAARYWWAEPYRHRRVMTPSLYLIRSCISSQWSSECNIILRRVLYIWGSLLWERCKLPQLGQAVTMCLTDRRRLAVYMLT